MTRAHGNISGAIEKLNQYLEIFMADHDAWRELAEIYVSLQISPNSMNQRNGSQMISGSSCLQSGSENLMHASANASNVYQTDEKTPHFPMKQILRMETNWYTSPEEVTGAPSSCASDIYHLAVLLFESSFADPSKYFNSLCEMVSFISADIDEVKKLQNVIESKGRSSSKKNPSDSTLCASSIENDDFGCLNSRKRSRPESHNYTAEVVDGAIDDYQNSEAPIEKQDKMISRSTRDGEFFATAGVNKKIKVFEYDTILDGGRDIHYPVVEMSSKSKLSSICWNGYIKSQIASSNFDGIMQAWDVVRNQVFTEMKEHEKRVWSVDYSVADPTLLASGSDDGSVKLWNINQGASAATIRTKANVCYVQFPSDSSNFLAFGSADHNIYYFFFAKKKKNLVSALVNQTRKSFY
ncbi:hypothetical protein POM88_012807 [Heracleum sosnowskyi]|uniref:EMC2 TPR-like domain-containing protein n=1 Tax=Heracleum sosnowskyi TaxID=360622 RepID=A0AAD8N2N3_9APIA|nr:hypothetical protein POM88_012807 [Heracleum sosnowskyi]